MECDTFVSGRWIRSSSRWVESDLDSFVFHREHFLFSLLFLMDSLEISEKSAIVTPVFSDHLIYSRSYEKTGGYYFFYFLFYEYYGKNGWSCNRFFISSSYSHYYTSRKSYGMRKGCTSLWWIWWIRNHQIGSYYSIRQYLCYIISLRLIYHIYENLA